MTAAQFGAVQSVLKVALAFVNAFAALLAAYPGPELSPLARLLAAAVVAGCGAALLMLNPPGGASRIDPENLTPRQRKTLVAAVKAEMQATVADPLPPNPRYPRKITESNQV